MPLWALVLLGFTSAAKVSLNNFNGLACPSLFSLPFCYLVLMAYGLVLASLMVKHNVYKQRLFSIGWGVGFVVTLFTLLVDIFSGCGLCPATGGGLGAGSTVGIPLCYLSMAILVVILVLFIKGSHQTAFDQQNSN